MLAQTQATAINQHLPIHPAVDLPYNQGRSVLYGAVLKHIPREDYPQNARPHREAMVITKPIAPTFRVGKRRRLRSPAQQCVLFSTIQEAYSPEQIIGSSARHDIPYLD